MSTQVDTTRLILNRIFHPSDFSPASEVAFAHALKLALITRAELRMMHVALDEEDMHWSDFSGVRATLVRWGLLPEGSPREAVTQLGLDIGKILYPRADTVGALQHYLDEHPPDLVVLTTHQRAGMARWLHRAVAEPVARRAGAMTLFLPQDVPGFITLDDGAVTLRRMLIPIDQVPRPQAAVDVAARAHPGLCHSRLHAGACRCHRRDASGPRAAPGGVDLGQDGATRGCGRADSRRRHGRRC
jgi:nucleotide-binding universal stress UspA family protein